MREYQEASTAVPLSLPPATPSPGLKGRVLAAATGRGTPRPAILTRVFWAAAAVVLFALMAGNLFHETEYTHSVRIKGTEHAPAAEGLVLWTEKSVRVEMTGLPALPPGKEYQLWQIGPEGPKPVAARTFRLDYKGDLAGNDWMKYLVAAGQTFAVTVEPAGGSRSPTMPIFAKVALN